MFISLFFVKHQKYYTQFFTSYERLTVYITICLFWWFWHFWCMPNPKWSWTAWRVSHVNRFNSWIDGRKCLLQGRDLRISFRIFEDLGESRFLSRMKRKMIVSVISVNLKTFRWIICRCNETWNWFEYRNSYFWHFLCIS